MFATTGDKDLPNTCSFVAAELAASKIIGEPTAQFVTELKISSGRGDLE